MMPSFVAVFIAFLRCRDRDARTRKGFEGSPRRFDAQLQVRKTDAKIPY